MEFEVGEWGNCVAQLFRSGIIDASTPELWSKEREVGFEVRTFLLVSSLKTMASIK